MSEVKVNKISPRTNCGTVQLGDSGDTITIPAGATIVNNGTQTGFGRTGTVDWDTTAKTASFTAVSGVGYFVNTTSGAITVTLPAGSAGSIVSLKDYANTWNTNNVTLTPNGTDKINGTNANAILDTQDQSVTLVYVDSTKGWRAVQDSTSDVTGGTFICATGGAISCCGDYKIHTFTGPGTFCVSSVGNPAGSTTVDYLVVAGGGAAGSGGGGGGAGGYRESSGAASGCYSASPLGACVSALPVSITGYPITVGGGGTVTPGDPPNRIGSNSSFSTITSAGGGGGGCAQACVPATPNTGGSGGGGAAPFPPPGGLPGGAGNTPPVSPPQGNAGGGGHHQGCVYFAAGGGGGATAVGGTGGNGSNPAPAGDGGVGATSSITASPVGRAGGGNGGGDVPLRNPSPVGFGGGGANSAGTANTGGGGGRSSAGGSGIVVIRYKFQ